MSGKLFIVLGDTTSHGGTVVSAQSPMTFQGKPVATVGDMTCCPECKGSFAIVQGGDNIELMGRHLARAGDKTACGAVLIPGKQTLGTHSPGGGAAQGAATATSASGKALASAVAGTAAAVAKAAAGKDSAQEKEIVRVYWSYGDDETPLSEFSRHYVDINLHVETRHYAPGETVEILLEDEDQQEITDGMKRLSLSAQVDASGVATVKNVLAGQKIEIISKA
ncbi:hypothetical protein GCM10007860_31860 [Chitiniphilus shinanonensis]|uniref:PAAR domain-containing protein n=1 Tax=Chitiniphilus shinanonensis TaxID=553088 RepID=A0ABQ6BW81_9NEIS|nr:PAAR domain-containing protein [Chitiniphilus shinanonensis]GLS06021.1 hypothetical protein GCM10007860_31860 [Chitiniphilus shinanonensis]